MTTKEIHDKHSKTVLDNGKTLQDNFAGKHGPSMFRHAVVFVVMGATHKAVKLSLREEEEIQRDFERAWQLSGIPNHPLHKARKSIEDKIADYAEQLDDLDGGHIQHKFAWVDGKLSEFSEYVKKKAAGAGGR